MVLLYGCAGRLPPQNGGFRPGQEGPRWAGPTARCQAKLTGAAGELGGGGRGTAGGGDGGGDGGGAAQIVHSSPRHATCRSKGIEQIALCM
jgi:hypothetical protein